MIASLLFWAKQKMPTRFLLRALLAIFACVFTFSTGTWWGMGIGKNQEKAKHTNAAINERNAIILASQKIASDNAALNQKFDAWLAQYQQQSNALTEKMNDEIATNRNIYACRIPASGMRLRVNTRSRANQAASSGIIDAALLSTSTAKR
jgi:hypothetical protein